MTTKNKKKNLIVFWCFIINNNGRRHIHIDLNLSLLVDQPTISSISNDKEVNESDTTTITCTVDSIPQSIISWIFETKELQTKYDGSLTLNKIDCLSMGRYTCQAVNMLGGDNRSVDVTVKCEYYIFCIAE